MTKIKKFSAMVLAVLMMMVVLTGCGGSGDPNSRFVQRLNASRGSAGYLIEDGELNESAKTILNARMKVYRGEMSLSDYNSAVNQFIGVYGKIDHGTATVTYVTDFKADASTFFNDPNYTVTGPVTWQSGRYVGAAYTRVGDTVYIVVVLAS